MPTGTRPSYIRLVGADERATLLYRVEDIGKGITPQELYERERQLPLTVLAAYEAIASRYGVTAGVRFLDGCASEGWIKRHRRRDDGWCYLVRFHCLIPGIEDLMYRAIIAWTAEKQGIPQKQVRVKIRVAQQRERDLKRRRAKQCSRDCGCFEVGMPCGRDGRIYPGDRRTLQK